MALCAAYACILGWLQFLADSVYHMAHTDVNTAFYGILAPTGMSEYFILPRVSTQLLLLEGVKVPDHLRHSPDVSPQRQVLATVVFLGLSAFCREVVESCVRVAGFFAGRIAHGSPLGACDDSSFGIYVDGVCAVGCDRPKVLSAMEAVKATVDAAGLQCFEDEADASRQDFTGLRLDHETGILSLQASRIWLRHGLEFAACQKQLTGDQVAKLIGHITWSCLLRRPALSLINAGYRCAGTFGPRSGRLWPAVAQEIRFSSPWSPWVYAADASGEARGGYGVTRLTQWMLRRQAAVQNGGGYMQKNLSAFDDQPWSNTSGKCRKPVGCVLFGGVWRKLLEILRREGKTHVMGLRHPCRSTESLGKRLLFLLDNMAFVLGASKGWSSAPSLNHTCRDICVISLATFTILVCRWIASDTNLADECILMLVNVGRHQQGKP